MSDWWNADPVANPGDRFKSNPRGFTTADVQAAVRGDAFNAPNLPIKYEAQPGQTFGVDATRNAQPFQNIVAHHTGGPTLAGALDTARRGDPFRSDVKYGYHFYIDTDGTVVQGAPMDARTNHVQPPGAAQRTDRPDISNNNSVGVSFVGTGSNPNPQQLAAAENLSRALMDRYGIRTQNVVGHGEIQSNRQTSEGMPLVNAIRNPQVAQAPQPQQPAPQVAQAAPAAPSAPPMLQAGGVANAEPAAQAALPPPASKPAQANWWDNDPVAKPEKADIGRGTAALVGAAQGATLNFGDELAGLRAASGMAPKTWSDIAKNPMSLTPWGAMLEPIVGAARLGYENYIAPALGINQGGVSGLVTGDQRGAATKQYEAARDQFREAAKTAQEQHPGYYTAGNVGGSLVLPVGAVGQAATLPGRMAAGAVTGGVVGGLSGVGEGENLADRATKGAIGTVVGAGIGGVAPPLVDGAIQAGRVVAAPVVNAVRGAINPAVEAGRRIVGALERDIRIDPNATNRLTPQEFAASQQAGGPARVVDLGGETTKALARSAANTSPEGRQILNQTINDRFEGQVERVSNWLRNTFNFPNAAAQRDAIEAAGRAANTPAYAIAMRDGAGGVWDAELQRLAGAPAIQEAARGAVPSLANRGITEGFRAPRQNPLTFDPTTGLASLARTANGNRTIPDLRFWDQVKRNLDSMVGKAERNGDNAKVQELTALRAELVSNLDRLVPSYQQARAGAAHFFGAENALQAGQNFVTQNFATHGTRRALAQMSPSERQLFQDGFVSRLVETINRTGDRRNILNQIAESPAAREKLRIALGPQRADQLEAGLRVEGIMDMARGAVQGNSTTARQLAELGLAGGAGVTGITGIYNQDPNTMTIAAISAALIAGKRGIDTRVARNVATMLASDNPQVIARGLNIVARNGRFMDALRGADKRLATIGGSEGSQAAAPTLQAAGTGRADDQPNVPRPPGQ